MNAKPLTPLQVVGIGLDGVAGLLESVRPIVARATLLVGSARHLSYFPDHPAQRLVLQEFAAAIAQIRHHLTQTTPQPPTVVILTSGDPLCFGLGRLLLAEFPPEQLTFHPHLSSIQLAFSRVKVPWQDALLISAHGRSLEELTQAVRQGAEKIAVLTDGNHNPATIGQLLQSLDLPYTYHLWVCENLGSEAERVTQFTRLAELGQQTFAPLNVVILLRQPESLPPETLPLLGLPERSWLSFPDRPGLITKREVRVLALAELALQTQQILWDVGAGTGSVAIEIARLCPNSTVYAVEKTAAGHQLIQQNCQRLQVQNVIPVLGSAPEALAQLPNPDRVFIGGSGGQLVPILELCHQKMQAGGVVVLAIATLEHLQEATTWLRQQHLAWEFRLLQVQLARSTEVARLTRLAPLNPVTLVTATRLETRPQTPAPETQPG